MPAAALAHRDCEDRCGRLDDPSAHSICAKRCLCDNQEEQEQDHLKALRQYGSDAPQTCRQPLWVNGRFRGYWDPCSGETLQMPFN